MALRKSVTVDEACAFLNAVMEQDPYAMRSLVENREPFPVGTLDHVPGLQGRRVSDGEAVNDYVGLIGIINGLFGETDKGEGAIATIYNRELDGDPGVPMFVVVRRPS